MSRDPSSSREPGAEGGDPADERPKYRKLQATLTELIASRLSPGDAIPSERELMVRFEVSRTTVRTAITELVNDGVLQRRHGKGTFVAEQRVTSRLHLASFSEDMDRRGLRAASSVLRAEEVPADTVVAEALGVALGASCARIERLRFAGGRPMAHEIAHYALHRLPGLLDEDLTGSIYGILRDRYRLPPDDGEQLLWSEPASEPRTRLLEVAAGSPLLAFQRSTYSRRSPIEYTTSWYRGDRYLLTMRLGPRELERRGGADSPR